MGHFTRTSLPGLDENGNKIGVPIKASSIHSKSALEYLEKKFTENEARKPHFKRV